MKKLFDSILIISFMCFGIASAVTTFLGVYSVLQDQQDYVRLGLSTLLAIGTSGAMLYIGYKVPEYKNQGKIILVVLAYLLIASLSIFFNFVTFYESQIKSSTADNDIQALNNSLSQNYLSSIKYLDNKYSITELKDSIAFYKASAKSEEEHAIRPGKKWRWQKLKESLNLFESQYEKAKKEHKDELETVNKLNSETSNILSEVANSEESFDNMALDKAITNINKLININKSMDENYVYDLPVLGIKRVNRPDYILEFMSKTISNYDTIEDSQKSKFNLSLFFSILLDIPIFLTMVLVGSDGSANRRIKIWE